MLSRKTEENAERVLQWILIGKPSRGQNDREFGRMGLESWLSRFFYSRVQLLLLQRTQDQFPALTLGTLQLPTYTVPGGLTPSFGLCRHTDVHIKYIKISV